VAVQFEREVTAPGQDGQTWLLLALDADGTRHVKASLSDTQRQKLGDASVSVEDLECAVELAAPLYSTGGRFDDPLPEEVVLRPEHFR
jgi:hypothetical protein